MEVPARPREGSVTPARPDNSSSTGLGGLEKPTPCPSLRIGPAAGLDGAAQPQREEGRTRPGIAAELLGSCRIDTLPSPSLSPPILPVCSRLACVSPPFPSPSHPAANKMAAAWPFCFPSGRGKPGRWDLALFWRLRPCSSPTLPSLRGTGCSKREREKKKKKKKKGPFGTRPKSEAESG